MTYLQFLLAEAMGLPSTDPKVLAAVHALEKAKVLDRWAVIRGQIQADPCRDYRVIMRRYHVSRGFVFASWGALAEPRGLSAASPRASG